MIVSAVDGQVLLSHSLIYTALGREIYDLKKTCLKDGSELPGTLLCREGGTTTDASGTRAYKASGNVYWFYNKMWGRDSYDDKGSKLMSSIHATFDTGMGCSGENAAWIPDPFNQMVYGDGGAFGLTLKDLTLGFDVAAHEMTHAVTAATSNLEYLDESGALNEAMSDIMGAAAESWVASGGGMGGGPATWTTSANTWKIGEDVAGLCSRRSALRLANDPTKDNMSKDYYPRAQHARFGGQRWCSPIPASATWRTIWRRWAVSTRAPRPVSKSRASASTKRRGFSTWPIRCCSPTRRPSKRRVTRRRKLPSCSMVVAAPSG